MMNKGFPVVVSGPSGTGKSTVVKALLEADPTLRISISATTRKMRPGEVDGVDYVFMKREDFLEEIAAGKMLEFTEYCGNLYGSPLGPVIDYSEAGEVVILEIESKGAMNVKKQYREAVTIFVVPPTFKELRRRLAGRGTEDQETMDARLEIAKEELKIGLKYDYIIFNHQVDQCVRDIQNIIHAERSRAGRMEEQIEKVMEDA